MTAPSLIEQIARRAADLPPELQAEVLDFVDFVRSRHVRPPGTQAWLSAAWGCAPDFPDRPPQPPLQAREHW